MKISLPYRLASVFTPCNQNFAMQRSNEAGAKYDQLAYTYQNTTKGYKYNRNRLQAITDDPTLTDVMKDGTNTNIDYENTDLDQYSYDEIGQMVADKSKEIAEVQWNIAGKPTAFIRTASSTKPDVYFTYDAHNNKVSRTLVPKTGNLVTTYYVRDASGNIMAEYKGTDTEHHIYGSSRLGTVKNNVTDYDLTDHLGNVRTTLSDANQVVFAADYLPYGRVANKFVLDQAEFGYNGKEYDEDLGLQDYGFRWYDTEGCRFVSVDPLAHKYPAFSPYVYCYNNPINVIDPDGREGIVVSGSPGDHKNRDHFLINGLDRAKAAQKHTQRKGEGVTWIVYNDKENGFTQKQLDNYKAKAAKAGVTMMVVSDVDDIVDYVNDKTGGDSRKNDQVTSFYYVGHSTPGDLDVGYQGTGENFEPDDFSSDAFSSGCHVNLVGGCRTAVPGVFEDSNVTQFSEILDNKSKVYGSDVRVYYPGGVVKDAELVKKNNGTIVEKKGELPAKTQ